MNDLEQKLLQEHLEGTLPEERAGDLDQLLSSSPEARRFVAEHQALWEALGVAFSDTAESCEGSPEFRARVSQAARQVRPQRIRWGMLAGVAAAALVVLAVTEWIYKSDSPLEGIPAADREVVRYLHILRDMEMVELFGEELDLRGELEIHRAFSGELDNEG
ncbi:MAG: hypothetical protein P8N09_12940 [Planctomycetota bacterium]|jgi:anti-sigma factor RsiW|nr:hypothetical protein [Planctomycetota bacterium]